MNIKETLRRAGLAVLLLGAGAAAARADDPSYMDVNDEFGSYYQSVAVDVYSSRLHVYLYDQFGDPASTTTAITPIVLKVRRQSDFATVQFTYTPDDGATPFVVSSMTISVASGNTESAQFRVRVGTSVGPGVYYLEATVASFLGGGPRTSYYTFSVLASGSDFSDVSIRTDSQSPGDAGSFVTITPNRDGEDDAAVIRATPPDGPWEAFFSTVSFVADYPTAYANAVARYFMNGPGEIFWDGRDFQGRLVPNGGYFVRLQTPGGGIVDDSLSVQVLSPFIRGRAVDASANPIADVNVNAWGPGGGGAARTDADGEFFIGGLSEGQRYTLRLARPGYADVEQQDVAASANVGDVTLAAAAQLWVHLTVSQAPDHNIYGQVFGRNADYSDNVWGGLRLASGSATSDNGLFPTPSSWTVLGLLPNTEYLLTADMPEFGRVQLTTTTGAAGATYYWLPTLVRKANITGSVTVPVAVDTPYGGEWISVDAIRSGDTYPSAWGGAFIQDGQTTGNYRINGVDVGDYTLRTYARGYQSASINAVVTSTADVTANFGTLSTGGQINGTISVIGDSSQVESSGHFGGTNCGGGQVPVFVNAWSPETYQGSFAEVCLTTGTSNQNIGFTMKGLGDGVYEVYSFLPGFQIEPQGPNRVFVSNGAGSASITFRRLSGVLELSATYPSGDDPTQIAYAIQSRGYFDGGDLPSGNLDGNGRATITGLGTGLYVASLTNNNPGRGFRRQVAAAVTNGGTTSVSADLDENTYQVSGTVEMTGSISLPSPWSVTVSSVPGLQAVATSTAPKVLIRGSQGGDGVEVSVDSSGNFTATGLPSGAYEAFVENDLNFTNQCSGFNCFPVNMPEIAGDRQTFYIEDANVSGVNLSISNGVKLTGTISRPVGDDDVTARALQVALYRRGGDFTWAASSISLTGSSVDYTFSHLSEGDYELHIRDNGDPVRYVSPGAFVTIGSADATQDIELMQAGTIVGKLRDADTNTLLTGQNASQFLPSSFQVFAQANPWVPGGFAIADRGQSSNIDFDSQGQFTVPGLIPDTDYDVMMRGYELDPESAARGQRPYAPAVVSGIRVSAGQTVDLGIVDLNQGVSLSGRVTDLAGTPLPNIRVVGKPALVDGDDAREFLVDTFTNAEGLYILQGIDPNQRYFDILASPRFEGGDIMSQLAGAKYGEEIVQMVDVTDPSARLGVDFQLTEANGALSGRLQTVDGGALSVPFGDSNSFERQGMIFLHLDGRPLADNPIGEIEEPTDAQGDFTISGLKPGSYQLSAVSVGYAMARRNVIVTPGLTEISPIVLEKGGTVSGTITRPDGSNPSTSEVKFLVGVDEDFEEFVFGIPEESGEGLVSGYRLSGFKTGVTYSIIVVTGNDDLLQLRSGLTFSSADEEKTVNLVYRPSPPSAYVTQTRVGSRFTLRFFTTHKLRNLTDDDDDVSKIVTVTGGGTVVSRDISGSRDLVTVVYDAAPNEKTFTARLRFTSSQVDLDSPTGDNFTFDDDFKFFAGAARMRVIRIPNAIGGNLKMEGAPTACGFVSGIFGGDGINGSSNVEVGIVSASDLSDLGLSAPQAAPRARALGVAAAAQRLGPEAYPSPAMHAALQLAPSVSPFSAFYDIFLPAGVNHSFKKEALLTLTYDAGVTDPTKLNVYYYDPDNNVFLLEGNKRRIDTKNRTITVAVNHASTFVVLSNNASIVGANNYAGTEILLYNFPNPFDLKQKTVSLTNAPSGPTQTIDGTMIKYALPSGKSGNVKIEIYNVAGELVRTIAETAATGGTYYYTPWDGKNDGGKKVASGVYLARFTLNDGDERFFKMAVVK